MRKSNIEVCVKVKGKPVDEYTLKGYRQDGLVGKTFIEGRKGSKYELLVQNNSSTRRKVVLSVDGLNVLTGTSGWDRGYIVDAWSSISIPGWRIDNSKVADFEFSSVGRSYNEYNDAGDKNNVGVIGCMVFDEQPVTYHIINQYPLNWHWTPQYYNGTPYYGTYNIVGGVWPGTVGNSFDGSSQNAVGLNSINTVSNLAESKTSSMSASADVSERTRSSTRAMAVSEPVETQSIGTAWGKESTFNTVDVTFNSKPTASETLLIYYDDRRGLERRGINLSHRKKYHAEPRAFPGYRDGCPYPK